MNFRFGYRIGALQEVEVAAFVSLLDVLHKQFAVAAGVNSFLRAPGCTAAREFIFIDAHVQSPCGNVEFDDVSFFKKCKWPADKGFGGDVKNARPITCAAHSSVGNTNHIANSRL